ncbi:acyl-CoA carboxylase subunit epsilon [Streptomyces melanogenes]|uniref:acyl-CoA carboxylase subunit epsilon n=1 Tax=Streptomyces melanogenes TaxID=67326 RepID=UPI00167E9348|nr:acyl-CoA carboxylase subunit epsilon [Streptomyces melanogenes]
MSTGTLIRVERGMPHEHEVAAITAVLLALTATRAETGSCETAPRAATWCRAGAGSVPRARAGWQTTR